MSERTQFKKEKTKMSFIKDEPIKPQAGDPIPCGTTGTCYTTTLAQCQAQLNDKKLSGNLSDKNRSCIKYSGSESYSK